MADLPPRTEIRRHSATDPGDCRFARFSCSTGPQRFDSLRSLTRSVMEALLVLVIAHVILTPLILVFVVISQHRRIARLTARLENLQAVEHTATVTAPAAEVAPAAPAPVPQPPPPVPERRVHSRNLSPAPSSPSPSTSPSTSSSLIPFLRRIGLWPGEAAAGMDREALIMQWWLPRIGGMLALLSALFFGVYINQSTSPLFKCIELAGASVAIAGFGRFMERRNRGFGGVLLVTGLIMLYLTSVAAYVLPATRVIENPVVGALVQAAVLVFITVVGFSRRSFAIVALAFGFGFALGVFMAWEGLREGALIAAGLLFVAGATLACMPVFRRITWLIVPGPFVVALAFPLLALLRVVEFPRVVSMHVFLNFVFAGVTALALARLLGNRRSERILVSVGSSLALLSVFLFFRTFAPDALEWAALILGANMLAGALIAWAWRDCGFLAQLLFIKASFLFAVFVILHYAGDLRWMVLALQTAVVACAARRARRVPMELAAWAVAIASAVLHFEAHFQVLRIYGFVWWMMVVYPFVITAALALLPPVFAKSGVGWRDNPRLVFYAAVPVCALITWLHLFDATPQRDFELAVPFLILTYVAAVMVPLALFARWMWILASGLALVTGVLLFADAPFSAAQLGAILLACGVGIWIVVRREHRTAHVAENLFYPLAALPLTLWAMQLLGDWDGRGAVAYAMAAAIVAAGSLPRLRHVGAWAFLPPLILLASEPVSGMGTAWTVLALGCGLVWLAMPLTDARLMHSIGWARNRNLWAITGALLLWWHSVSMDLDGADWMLWQCAIVAIAALFLAGARIWVFPGYWLGTVLFGGTALLRHVDALTRDLLDAWQPWLVETLGSTALLYAIALAWFFVKPLPFQLKGKRALDRYRMAVSMIAALALFGVSVVTFGYEPLGWKSVYTPLLAVTSFAIILLGLFWRDRAFRLVGLLSLIVPLARLFMVDVKDPLHRILAFAAAAVLLTLLGYLYHRLASRLRPRVCEGR